VSLSTRLFNKKKNIDKPSINKQQEQYGHFTGSSTLEKEGYLVQRLDRKTLQSSLGQIVGTYMVSSQPSVLSLLKSIKYVNIAMNRTS
jgi:hypothetical protein